MGSESQFVDVARAIAAIDPGYLRRDDAARAPLRVAVLAWCPAHARLYIAVDETFVFWNDDGGWRWHEVAEINRGSDGALRAAGSAHIDAIVETLSGTVLAIGRDRLDGADRGVVWRKERSAQAFVRVVAADPAWQTGRAGNATAGYLGVPPTPAVAIAPYATPAHLHYSVDDGLSWRRHDLSAAFALHAHEVYLPRAANVQRPARLWVSGGDDPSGERSGVVTLDRVESDGTLGVMRFALRERPGYRLVGLAGDGKHVYIGNESIAGGMLRILDNAESIELGDFEYVLGKHRHDYHQFRSMSAMPDGVLAAASDGYVFLGDNVRADSGGYLYVSTDGGASFRELSLGMKWINALVDDGRYFWISGGMNKDDSPDPSHLSASLLRVARPGRSGEAGSSYCAKVVLADSSAFYEMAGYEHHPRAKLEPGERTFRTDLSPYASAVVDVDAYAPATLVVEALAFQTWTSAEDAWREIATIAAGAGRTCVPLAAVDLHNKWFRVRNAGGAPAEFRHIAFIARR